MLKKYREYIIQIAIALAVGGLSALAVKGDFAAFSELNLPPLTPPPAVFGIVWTVLFVLMGIGAGMAAKASGRVPVIYRVQLAVNFLWPIIFFKLRAYLFALAWLVLLWVLILFTMSALYRLSKRSAVFQIPYLLWVTFAGYLNFAIWLMN